MIRGSCGPWCRLQGCHFGLDAECRWRPEAAFSVKAFLTSLSKEQTMKHPNPRMAREEAAAAVRGDPLGALENDVNRCWSCGLLVTSRDPGTRHFDDGTFLYTKHERCPTPDKMLRGVLLNRVVNLETGYEVLRGRFLALETATAAAALEPGEALERLPTRRKPCWEVGTGRQFFAVQPYTHEAGKCLNIVDGAPNEFDANEQAESPWVIQDRKGRYYVRPAGALTPIEPPPKWGSARHLLVLASRLPVAGWAALLAAALSAVALWRTL